MKRLLLTIFLLAAVFSQAQVGINTDDPRALLDIKAANEVVSTNTPGVMVVGDGLLVPRVSTLLVDTDFPIEGLVVYLIATFEDTSVAPSVTYEPGFYVSYDSTWETFGDAEGLGQLRQLDEGNGIGFRIDEVGAERNPANYGNIGLQAVDLGVQTDVSSTTGATGSSSFTANTNNTASGLNSAAFGFGSIASGETSTSFGDETRAQANSSTAVGEFNTTYTLLNDGTDRLFIVGNGESGARSDALIVQKNGIITAPSMSTTEIDNAGDEVLITKEWYNFIQSSEFQGIEQVTEDGNTGLRRSDANPANYGNIGNDALDLSVSFSPSTTRGATGNLSFALGGGTTASGRLSTSFGRRTVASGRFSIAGGDSSTAEGDASIALGEDVHAPSDGEIALGRFNTDYSPTDTNTDRVFVVGSGTSDTSRADAFIVQKNGLITAPNLETSEILSGSDKALTTKEYNEENFIGRLESGDTASRPTGGSAPAFGTMRYNTQTGRAEVYVENSTDLPEGSTYIPGWVRL